MSDKDSVVPVSNLVDLKFLRIFSYVRCFTCINILGYYLKYGTTIYF